MNLNRPWQADSFWQFSLAVYDRDQVKQACLMLQDKAGLNVNVLLLACYLDGFEVSLSVAQIQQLLAAISDSDQALQQHRAVRRKAKGSEQYQALLAQELELEGAQQGLLIAQLNQFELISRAARDDALVSNLGVYAREYAVCDKTLYEPSMTVLFTQSRLVTISHEST